MSFAIQAKLKSLLSRKRNDGGDDGGGKKKRKTNKKTEKEEKVLKSIASDCVWSSSQEAVRRYLLDDSGRKRNKSCFISGGAGTGKSKLLQYITQYWRAHTELRFESTASIGTAAFSLQGTTFHRFVGLPLPLFQSGNLETMMKQLKKYARSRILSCQLLILDEVSIISKKTFETASNLMQRVRGNYSQPFGGVALVCCGDFCQLRPSEGEQYAFESPMWGQQLFTAAKNNVFILEEQFRQKDDAHLTRMLNHVRSGIVNDEVQLFFQLCELNQEDADELNSTRGFTYLASKRDMIEAHNQTCHELLRKENPNYPVRVYRRAKMPLENAPQYGGGGKQSLLSELEKRIPLELELLAGSEVLVTANLDLKRGLVNGTRGKVVSVASTDDESVQIVLADGTIESIQPYAWQGRDAKTGAWFEVTQLPLIRSWGFTIHKSQGQTFHNGVLLNAHGIPNRPNDFSYGQFYVAASRAKSRQQLAIIGWHRNKVHADPRVLRWYTSVLFETHNLFPNVTDLALETILNYLF